MKSILLFAALCTSGAVQAQGFAPWETRDVVKDVPDTSAAVVTNSGFAPWDAREVVKDVPDASAAVVTNSGFAPWDAREVVRTSNERPAISSRVETTVFHP